MAHEGQKRLNKIAFDLMHNEIDMGYRQYERTPVHEMRALVKKEKLHYSKKMYDKTQLSKDILRMQIGRTTKNGIVISTVRPYCLAWYGNFETAINFGDGWRIVEGYSSKKQAIKGHEKYKKMSVDELAKIDWID